MKQKTTLLLGAAIVFSSSAVGAEQYGALSFGLGSAEITDNDSPEGTGTGVSLQGFVGFQAANGIRYELDYGVRSESDSNLTSYDGLSSSRFIAARAAYDYDSFNVEGAFGEVRAETDEGTSVRQFVVIGGTYDVMPQLYVQGALGHLTGLEGTDDDGEDGISNLTTLSIGAGYDVTDRLTVELGFTYGEGDMDDDTPREAATVKSASLGATYDLGYEGMSVYGRYIAADYFQAGEDDDATERRIELGLTVAFGGDGDARSRRRMDIPRYDDWLAVSAGVLE
jgi:predicted porin